MGTDDDEVKDFLPCSFKVHSPMCSELLRLIDRVMEIFPDLEAARPRCSSGISALCLLSGAIGKGKLLLQYCSQSSKLYLAATGDAIVRRCERTTNLMEDSLDQIQSMVPLTMALKIGQVIDDLKIAVFTLDSSEEEAGKAVRELLQQSASASLAAKEESEAKALQFAASRLQIATPKTILVEKRSIRRLLGQVSDGDSKKRDVLKYLLHLLRKYGSSITDQQKNHWNQHEEPFASGPSSDGGSLTADTTETESNGHHRHYNAGDEISFRAVPPEEFRCPLSRRIMYDPVITATDQTFERLWIQKWFDEGNRTCPKTKVTLDHLSLTPNRKMKVEISRWCSEYGLTVHDPSQHREACSPLDVSAYSIASLGSDINDFHLPSDMSCMSLGTSDSYSETSHSTILNESSLVSLQIGENPSRCQTDANLTEKDLQLLSKLSELSKEAQRKAVEDLTSHLKNHEAAFQAVSAENFIKPLVKFLEDSHERSDIGAARAALQLLLTYLRQNRKGTEYLGGDAFDLLSYFLDTELTGEALDIMEVLSASSCGRSRVTHSRALRSILEILNLDAVGFKASALKILQNLSSSNYACCEMVNLRCIPKLSPFLNDLALAGNCLKILRNMCDLEKARASVAETDGCIASVAEFLESENKEEQENAAAILLSLCSQCVQYCRLVMEEGMSVVPSLVHVSINGNDKARANACELLRLLKDIDYEDTQEAVAPDPASLEPAKNPSHCRSALSRPRRLLRFIRRRV